MSDVEKVYPDHRGGLRPAGGLSSLVFTGRVRMTTDWIAPLDSETPFDFDQNEHGAYW